MPKIVIKVNRTAHTRSKSQKEPKVEGEVENSQKKKSTSREVTPAKKTIKIEAQSGTRSKNRAAKHAEKKYFTVLEDNTIIQYYKQHQGTQTVLQIAEALTKKVKHSEESIRDRIRKILTRLRHVDETLIAEEAKVIIGLTYKKNPDHYTHVTRENARGRRTVSHFSSMTPTVAGTSLSGPERRAVMREYKRIKQAVNLN